MECWLGRSGRARGQRIFLGLAKVARCPRHGANTPESGRNRRSAVNGRSVPAADVSKCSNVRRLKWVYSTTSSERASSVRNGETELALSKTDTEPGHDEDHGNLHRAWVATA